MRTQRVDATERNSRTKVRQAARQLFTQKSQAFANVGRLDCPAPQAWVSCSVPPAATRSGKSARPDGSQPGRGSTNNLNPNLVTQPLRRLGYHKTRTAHHRMDKSNHTGSTPARKILAH